MRLITVPKDQTVKYTVGTTFVNNTKRAVEDTFSFFEFLERLVNETAELGKADLKTAKRVRKLRAMIDHAEAEKLEIVKLEDADFDAIHATYKKGVTLAPEIVGKIESWCDAIENAQEEKGPVREPAKQEG